MWLAYGRNKEDKFVHVSEVKRGKSALACPHCGGLLTARKGRIKAHHFAHTSKTCQTSVNYDFYDITKDDFPVEMGLYDYAIQRKQEIEQQYSAWQQELDVLTKKVAAANAEINEAIQLLIEASKAYKNGNRPKNRQKNFDVLQQLEAFQQLKPYSPSETLYPALFEVRHSMFRSFVEVDFRPGNIYIGQQLYWAKQLWEYERYEKKKFVPERLAGLYKIFRAYAEQKSRLNQLQVDIPVFEQEQKYFQQFTLYFLEVRADTGNYHKIGITGRTVDDRLKEVEQDARKLGNVTVSIRNQVKGYAFLETFFKRKYADHHIEFRAHTEYFTLPADVLKEIETDLGRLEYLSLDRIGKIKAGMQKAKDAGKQIGRPAKEEKAAAFLRKPKSQEIAALLDQDLSLRKIQRQTGYSINTIRKVNSLRDSYK